MAADGSKKPKTQESSDHMDSDYVLSIQKLQDVQDELEKVNEQAAEEVLQLEQKYNEIKKPVFERREEIIKTIPHFWLTAFSSHPVLGELLNGEDRKIFKYLDSLEVEDFKDVASGYSLTFNFKPNPFFEDTKLVKKYTFLDEGITRISVSAIKWKEGMGPAAVGSLEKGNKRPLPEDSFISWFSDDQQKEFTDGVVADEVAEIIKEDLWTNPLKYFSMEGDEESSDGDEDDEDDEEESIDEEDEDDEDSDSED